jgi:hypothetical protein
LKVTTTFLISSWHEIGKFSPTNLSPDTETESQLSPQFLWCWNVFQFFLAHPLDITYHMVEIFYTLHKFETWETQAWEVWCTLHKPDYFTWLQRICVIIFFASPDKLVSLCSSITFVWYPRVYWIRTLIEYKNCRGVDK